jgi:hypothetical protein
MGEWKPTKTPPTDERLMCLACIFTEDDVSDKENIVYESSAEVVLWRDGVWKSWDDSKWSWVQSFKGHTHWMPLPDPPRLS